MLAGELDGWRDKLNPGRWYMLCLEEVESCLRQRAASVTKHFSETRLNGDEW